MVEKDLEFHPFYEVFLKPEDKLIDSFVESVQGPIMLFYIFKLNLLISTITKTNNCKVFFLYRSGLRIYDLLMTYLEERGIDPKFKYDFLKISRLLSIKLLYLAGKEFFIEVIRKNYDSPSEACNSVLRIKKSIDDYECFKTDEELQNILLKESHLIYRYLKFKLENYRTIVLVDEGWSGSIILPLEIIFPEKNFVSFFFGRIGSFELMGQKPKKIYGIIFDSPNGLYDKDKKETCIIFHKHWIESFFEPSNISSTEKIDEKDFVSRNFDRDSVIKINDYVDKIYLKVKEFIKNNAKISFSKLLMQYKTAISKLHDMIINPTLEDLKILRGKFRTHDLGKKGGLYAIFPPFNRFEGDSRERRIKDSLWKFGQILIEYPRDPILRVTLRDRIIKNLSCESEDLYFLEFKNQRISNRLNNYLLHEEIRHNPNYKVAIIMRTKNRPILLKRAIDSVSSQILQNYILVIVNDGGDINSIIDILKNSKIHPSKVKIIHHSKSKGMEAASNSGIKSVKSKYIVIHDDDDSWYPEFLLKTVKFLYLNSNYKGVITKCYYIEELITQDGNIIEKSRCIFNDWLERIHISEICIQNLYPPIAFIYDREIYDKIGGYDESLPVLGDWDFNIRFLMESDIGVIKEVLANYHVRLDPTSLYRSSLAAGQNLHFEYNAILRNKYFRKALNDERFFIIAQLFSQAYYQEDNRFRFHLLLNKREQ